MPRIEEAIGRSAPFIKVQPPAIIAQRAPVTTDTNYPLGQVWLDQSATPSALYTHIGGGVWDQGGNAIATNTVYGLVQIDTDVLMAAADDLHVPTALAIKTYADNLAIAGSPVSTVDTAGIGELATDAEAVAGTASTGVLALFVTPSNLTPVFASAPDIGGTAAGAGTFDDLTADGTGTVSLVSNAAALFDTTGAGIDLTLSSDAGRVIINGEEAAANAITLSSVAGGLDVDVALQMNLASSQNAATAIVMSASAGGIDITAAGAPAEDIDITCTSGSVRIVAGESATDSIVISSSIGGIDITAAAAGAGEDIDIAALGSSVNISSSENAADAITIDASAGGIDITNTGTAGEDIDIASTGASVNVTSTENAALAIHLHANGGTSETIKIHSDQGTGVASLDLLSDVGGITLTSGLSSADAINLNTSAAGGGIDIDSGTAGTILDSTGAISLDAAAQSNFSTTGAGIDLLLDSASGRVIVTAGEDAADAIYLHADAGTSEKIRVHSDQGTGVDSVQLVSDVGGITLTSGLASSDAINFSASAGGVDIDAALDIVVTSTENSADSILLHANGGTSETIKIHSDQGTAVTSLDLLSDAGGITLTAGLATSDAINLVASAGGVDVDAALDIVLTSTENAADSILLHANGGTSETIKIHSDQGTAVTSLDLLSDVGGITLTSGLASADAINFSASAGGVDLDGALEVNIASSQAASSAITLSVSNAAGGITHTGKCIYTPDAITSDNAGVAASVSTVVTEITTDGDSNEDNVTLANGVDGQIKIFAVVAAGNAADSVKITPANMIGGTKITFAADPTGDGCMMVFDSGVGGWCVVGNNAGTVA